MAGRQLDLRARAQRTQAGQHGRRQAGGLDRKGARGQVDALDHDLETVREGDAEAGDEPDLADAATVDAEPAAQREQPQVAAAQAEHRVALADPRVVELQRGAPQPADDVAGAERARRPVGQAEGREGAVHRSRCNIDAPRG
ncbi:hypothetical protein [Nannocystis pusilla]|uniref:hypothetical protein n=1 Tax=Nannocystis pusilla TaxID=889268 RepID=UPI003DA3CC5D